MYSKLALMVAVIVVIFTAYYQGKENGRVKCENSILISEAELNEKQKKVRAKPPSLDVVVKRLHAGTF